MKLTTTRFIKGLTWPIGPISNTAHVLKSTYRTIFSQTFKVQTDLHFGCFLMEMLTNEVCEEKSQSLRVPQPPVSWIVTRTHLKEKGYFLLCFSDYLFLMYLKQYVKYLEVHLIASKAINQKQEKFFFLASDWTQDHPVNLLLCNLSHNISCCLTRDWNSLGTRLNTRPNGNSQSL